ncbi:MAG: hypothetical protein ACD_79C00949G0004 [uncultured bacterium]|nr:MAG: hypothetical protein ACD_79C00949G0004 [uncultured bacterium]
MARVKHSDVSTGSFGCVVTIIIGLVLIAIIAISVSSIYVTKTISQLLTENKKLKESLVRLTQEDQIGFAKVVKQEKINNKIFTTLKFVETARDDKLKRILEKEYTIEGNIIHFDAIVVKFNSQLVSDGKERSLYLWRRIYGETMSPDKGFPIEDAGKEPSRYLGLLEKLRLKDQETFWSGIWDLANDPQTLSSLGVDAIFGNVVYTKLKPGLVYIFKISNTGQLIPETAPEM